MGYRSTVVVAIHKDALAIKKLENSSKYKEAFQYADETTESDNIINHVFYDIKWYEDFLSIKLIYAFLESLKPMKNTEESWAVLQVGEDNATCFEGNTMDLELEISMSIDTSTGAIDA